MADTDAQIEGLSFETALAELEALVARLESGTATLEESITLYERGSKLKAQCEKRLADARMRVEQIVDTPSGPGVEPATFS